jgi:uncharacterized lipoprotein YddW (UPF0748 family)
LAVALVISPLAAWLGCDHADPITAPITNTGLPAVSSGPPEGVSAEAETKPALVQKDPETASDVRYRGLWVLCEGSRRVLEDPARIDVLIEDAQALEVTDLFVQVYRGGRAWFASQLADDAPYRAILAQGSDDPLALLIERAHGAGLRVHAWVNVLSLSRNRQAPILQELGPGAIHVDRRGRSILDYPADLELPETDQGWYRIGTPGIYLDPAAPGVSERLVAVFRELVLRYPRLDGLHLDYIRHPGVLPFAPGSRFGVGLDFGYGEASRLRFRRETGLRGPYADDAAPDPARLVNANRWDAWRREKVTQLVAAIGDATSKTNPQLRLSAAVISYLDRAYLSLAQDWRRWLEEGLVDFVVPMVYSKDDRLLRYQVEAFARGSQSQRIWAGVGVWLFEHDPERARAQLEIVHAAKLGGDALFSYDSIYRARADANQPGDAATGSSGRTAAPAPNLFSVLADRSVTVSSTAPSVAADP